VTDQPTAFNTWWSNFLEWVTFWNGSAPSPNELYFTMQCAFAPAAAAALAENPANVQEIGLLFGNSENATAPGGFVKCKAQGWGGDDWFPVLNGSQVRLGCTAIYQGSIGNLRSFTGDFACFAGAEIKLASAQVIRTYVHHNSFEWSNTVGSWRAPLGFAPPTYDIDCDPAGLYQGGVVPPDWPAGDVPPWADVTGCNGLTIKSDDISGETFEDGDEIPMWLAPLDPERPPAGVDVQIRAAEANPGGGPLRWAATASWPNAPDFTFIVGPDTDQHDWVFRLTCSDGTSKLVFYDPTGDGGNRRPDGDGPGDVLEECIGAAGEIGLDPSSWVPGLVDRIKCLFQWATSTTNTVDYELGRLQDAAAGTGLGDAAQIATAPYRTLGALSSGASQQTTITTGMGVITLPAVDELTASRIRLALSVLLGLAAIKSSIGMWSRAANSRVVDDR
jgi:hypothetical protein